MKNSVTDHIICNNNCGTAQTSILFSDKTILQNWLDIESALAQSNAELGVIPKKAASEICAKAQVDNLDVSRITSEATTIQQTLLSTINALKSICVNDAGQYVGIGATVQDIIDTGFMISIKKAFELIKADIFSAQSELLWLIETYRNTPMASGSHERQGVPITFGYKCAGWASELQRDLERMADCGKRCLVGEMHGTMGTMTSFGENGMEISDRTIRKLMLDIPDMSWHNSRDRIAEICHCLSITCCTLGRIGSELSEMQRNELLEIAANFGGEEMLPTAIQQRETSDPDNLMELARLVKNEANAAQESMLCPYEHDEAAWCTEWRTVCDCVINAGACAAKAMGMIHDLQVFPEMLRENLAFSHELLMSERITIALGDKIGNQEAHKVVSSIAARTIEEKARFRDMLMANKQITDNLSLQEIEELLDPDNYISMAGDICDRVLSSIKHSRRKIFPKKPATKPWDSADESIKTALFQGWGGL